MNTLCGVLLVSQLILLGINFQYFFQKRYWQERYEKKSADLDSLHIQIKLFSIIYSGLKKKKAKETNSGNIS
jgi:hypothetical protein